MKPKILIIDDELNTREGLKMALEDKYDITLAENAIRGLMFLKETKFEIVLTDLRMPGMDGMDFIRQTNAIPNPPLIIMLTAYGSVQTALEAMKVGAYDYIAKPVDIDNLESIIQRGLATRSTHPQSSPIDFIAESPAMQRVLESVRQVADSKATILITGESGTGKEVIARAIHDFSSRNKGPFVPVHCAALNENLLESELFGHEKGAYTGATERSDGRFQAAEKGTLFLDEIGEISLATQVKLLRVLETKTFERVGGKNSITVDSRLVAATNRNLEEMVKEGTFREDLFYRLNVVSIHLPPLRERKEDIKPLLEFFLHKATDENGRHIAGFSPEAIKLLETYQWPGNVRELRNTVERMVVFSQSALLSMMDIPTQILDAVSRQFTNPQETVSAPPVSEKTQFSTAAEKQELDIRLNEKNLILQALKECNGNRSHAAEKLHISRRTLQRKLHEFGIS